MGDTPPCRFDLFSSGFVSLLAAEQTEESPDWFQGTADAVRQSLRHFANHRYREMLILSGDQLYQMDYRRMLETHRRHVADITVGVTPVTAEQAHAFGILKVNRQGRIVHFEEKPTDDRLPDLVSDWPGLGNSSLYEGRDLRPTLDTRAILKGALAASFDLTATQVDRVFPGSDGVRGTYELMK